MYIRLKRLQGRQRLQLRFRLRRRKLGQVAVELAAILPGARGKGVSRLSSLLAAAQLREQLALEVAQAHVPAVDLEPGAYGG